MRRGLLFQYYPWTNLKKDSMGNVISQSGRRFNRKEFCLNFGLKNSLRFRFYSKLPIFENFLSAGNRKPKHVIFQSKTFSVELPSRFPCADPICRLSFGMPPVGANGGPEERYICFACDFNFCAGCVYSYYRDPIQ